MPVEFTCLFCGRVGTAKLSDRRRYCSCSCRAKAHPKKRLSLEAKFWRYVERDAAEKCWSWEGRRNRLGYGTLTHGPKQVYAHRLAYELHIGPIPSGADILHACDNRACVNPYHLKPGTHRENMREMVERERSCRGEAKPSAKLTESEVRQIRDFWKRGHLKKTIASWYAVNPCTITAIVNGTKWRHVSQ